MVDEHAAQLSYFVTNHTPAVGSGGVFQWWCQATVRFALLLLSTKEPSPNQQARTVLNVYHYFHDRCCWFSPQSRGGRIDILAAVEQKCIAGANKDQLPAPPLASRLFKSWCMIWFARAIVHCGEKRRSRKPGVPYLSFNRAFSQHGNTNFSSRYFVMLNPGFASDATISARLAVGILFWLRNVIDISNARDSFRRFDRLSEIFPKGSVGRLNRMLH